MRTTTIRQSTTLFSGIITAATLLILAPVACMAANSVTNERIENNTYYYTENGQDKSINISPGTYAHDVLSTFPFDQTNSGEAFPSSYRAIRETANSDGSKNNNTERIGVAQLGPTGNQKSNVVSVNQNQITNGASYRAQLSVGFFSPNLNNSNATGHHFTISAKDNFFNDRDRSASPLSWISLDSNTINRGFSSGNGWSSGGSTGVNIDLAGFLNYPDTVVVPLGDGSYRAYTYVAVNRCFGGETGCGGDNILIEFRIPGIEILDCLKAGTCPGDEGQKDQSTTSGTWSSTSHVRINSGDSNNGWGVNNASYRGQEFESIDFSTDDSTVNLTFIHRVSLNINTSGATPRNGELGGSPVIEDAKTNYTISGSGGIGGGPAGNIATNSYYGGGMLREVPVNVSVSLSPGQTRTVCQTINYSPKYYSGWTETPVYRRVWIGSHVETRQDPSNPQNTISVTVDDYGDRVDHYEYKLTGNSGSGNSQACATITRPNDPSGDGAKISSPRVYTGERVSVHWDTNVPYYNTRRSVGQQAPYMVHPIDQGRITGGRRESRSPLQIYAHEWSSDSGGGNISVVAPSLPGFKVCASFGYNIQFFWSANGGGYQPENRSYWYDYGLTCSYIAKKPSLAIWNSNLFTSSASNVKTAISSRDNAEERLALVAPSGSATTFGSWGEFLGVIGGANNGFATGATRSTGNTTNSADRSNPLTIANTNANNYGYSRVSYNSAILQRFETYFKTKATPISGATFGGTSLGHNQTAIYHSNHSLTIDQNITNHNGSYGNIYELPQTIIFVDGDVNIASNVTQIDAWIVASGKVNTCVEFQRGVTSSSTRNSGTGGACQQQITFNGPVIASSLELRRSFGADLYYGQKYTTAEIFNYRADSVLWSYAQAGRYASSYNEAYIRELAPRY